MSADPIIARDSSTDFALPRWTQWCELVRAGALPVELGFSCEHETLNRANARFRVASGFRGILLESFGVATSNGYGSLFRLFLTWTAFEQYCKGLVLSASRRDAWFSEYVPADAEATVRRLDPENRLFSMVHGKTRGEVRANIDSYLRGTAYGFTYLPAGLRHLFAHGELTPHANRTTPEYLTALGNFFADTLLHGLAVDFERRLKGAVNARAA